MEIKYCAQIIIIHPLTREILGVSRKTDHNDFGLCGGKWDEGDLSPAHTAIREMLEEIGLIRTIDELIEVYGEESYQGLKQHTFLMVFDPDKDILSTDEPHVIKWCKPEVLMAGSFGDFNERAFKAIGLYKEAVVTEVVQSNTINGVQAQLTLIDDEIHFAIGEETYKLNISVLDSKMTKHIEKLINQTI